MFHENWYSDEQCEFLSTLINQIKHLNGKFIEIGCWEGKSTVSIANSCWPQNLDAVDTWQGNIDENPNHATITLLKQRDIFAEFLLNIKQLTKNNVTPHKIDCFIYLSQLNSNVKFCHIDACHDYKSVKSTITLLLPHLVPGAILCGDDYILANITRSDLDGGVQRAVIESLPNYHHNNNLWWWQKPLT